ncbi:MAG: CDGSH iron-sulfur domain-containing protein [Pseudomonadota bacterium]|jgi:CDGSH-type Zn-finger protein|nr:CDGSH iron-sulfur domain-containing protein [Pseudomonadota bacterium]
MTTIKVLQNGPYQVEGDAVALVDASGAKYAAAMQPLYLCRCGASKNKPFCDGTHAKIGFKAAESAQPAGGPPRD